MKKPARSRFGYLEYAEDIGMVCSLTWNKKDHKGPRNYGGEVVRVRVTLAPKKRSRKP